MTAVNMLEAKTHLSRLVDALERGAEREIVIARNGKPVARLVAMAASPVEQRIGVALTVSPSSAALMALASSGRALRPSSCT